VWFEQTTTFATDFQREGGSLPSGPHGGQAFGHSPGPKGEGQEPDVQTPLGQRGGVSLYQEPKEREEIARHSQA